MPFMIIRILNLFKFKIENKNRKELVMGRDYQPSKCRSCGAKIMWVETKKGKNMPIDYNEDLEHRWADICPGTKPMFDAESMTSHFDTCPNASDHRR